MLLAILLLQFFSPSAHAAEVRVAIAANFTGTAKQLIKLFEQQTPHTVRASYGSTGKLYAQIVNGAPYDILLAADTARPRRLVEEGRAVADSRFTYARGKLVLWSADPLLFLDGRDFLEQGELRRLAIANPQTAPYGLAAQQALEKLGVWQRVAPRLVRGDSIAQAFQFVATSNAEAGLVAASQVKEWPHAGSQWTVPTGLYAPIAQQAVTLKRGKENTAAAAFMRFLTGTQARKVIQQQGYAVE